MNRYQSIYTPLSSCVCQAGVDRMWNAQHAVIAGNWTCNREADVSSLRHVWYLSIFNMNLLLNMNALSNLHRLELVDTYITDVSALGSIHELVIRDCNSLEDVSALGNVHDLKLVRCKSIKDVSSLGGVCHLELNALNRVRDVSMLATVHTLKMKAMFNVHDVRALRETPVLWLYEMIGVDYWGDVMSNRVYRHGIPVYKWHSDKCRVCKLMGQFSGHGHQPRY